MQSHIKNICILMKCACMYAHAIDTIQFRPEEAVAYACV